MAVPKIKRMHFDTVSKAPDLDVHISTMTVTGSLEVYVDIRDYVPSTKTYGRGVVIPYERETLRSIATSLTHLAEMSVGETKP